MQGHLNCITASGAQKLVQILGGDFSFGNDTVAVAMRFAMKNGQGKILAVWILAAKLPNSDLNFVDFGVDFLLFLSRKWPRKIHQKIPRKLHPGVCPEMFPSNSAEAFS